MFYPSLNESQENYSSQFHSGDAYLILNPVSSEDRIQEVYE
jgi:hypothetical protein